jgi:hypothetical protein
VKFTLGGTLFKIDIADTIDNKNLAVLSDSALLCANRTTGKFGLDRSADSRVSCLFGDSSSDGLWLLCSTFVVTLSSTLLLSVPIHGLRFFLG